MSLAKDCPVENCNPADCPLHKVRQLTMQKRLRWLKALSDEDLTYLNAYHFVCMNTKLEVGTLKAGKVLRPRGKK